MSSHATGETPPGEPPATGPRSAIFASSLALLVIFVAAAAAGARAAARGDVALAALDPVVALLRDGGLRLTAWSLQYAAALCTALTAAAALAALAALASAPTRGLRLLPICLAIPLAAWAQYSLLGQDTNVGVRLYLAAMAAALAFGTLVGTAPTEPAQSRPPRWWVDGVAVTLLGAVGLVLRLHALDRLPAAFEGEMSTAMLASRTWAGIAAFVPLTAQDTSIGFAHMLVQRLAFLLFGSSVYSLRLAAAAFGVAMIPMMYWLMRGLSGRSAALVATLLLVTAPEQLWWSRFENVNFIAACFAGLATALVAWRFRRDLSVAAAAALAVWLPCTRFFYLAAVLLVTYPWLLFAHALVFARGRRRRLPLPAAVIAAGTGLWIVGLSVLAFAVSGQPWRFLNPATHGELVIRRDAQGRGAAWSELAVTQAKSLAGNAASVASSLTRSGSFSQWFERVDTTSHPTWLNVAVSAAGALSLSILLGRAHTAQASVLLGWLLVGTLPALLGTLPDSRRMCLAFPALYATIGFAAGLVLRAVRARGGTLAARLAGGFGAAGLVAVLASSAASHLAMPSGLSPLVRAQHWTEPVFRDSDAIYYDGDTGIMSLLVLGHAERFLARPPCVQFVLPNQWLNAVLQQPCGFDDDAFRAILTPAERERLAKAYSPPRRVTFLTSRAPRSAPALELLRSLFPEVPVKDLDTGDFGTSMSALSVDRAALGRLAQPLLRAGEDVELPAGFETGLLRGATVLRAAAGDLASARSGLEIDGGIIVAREGWYGVRLSPPCEQAEITIDGESVPAAAAPRPMLAGAHPFRIRFPALGACTPGPRVELWRHGPRGDDVGEAARLVSPVVVAAPTARANAVRTFSGYTDAGLLKISPAPLDARATRDGRLLVLLENGGRHTLRRYDLEERIDAEWDVELPANLFVRGMMVGPRGETLLVTEEGIWIFADGGKLSAHWPRAPIHSAEQTYLPDGRIAACVPEHSAVEIFRPDGTREQVFDAFAGGPGKFVEPVTIAADAAGNIVVGQTNGQMFHFRTPPDRFEPTYVGSFAMDFSLGNVLPRSLVFDGGERVLAGDPERLRTLVYGLDGVRCMASDPEKDWATLTVRTGEIRRLVPTPAFLYVLASEQGLRRLAR